MPLTADFIDEIRIFHQEKEVDNKCNNVKNNKNNNEGKQNIIIEMTTKYDNNNENKNKNEFQKFILDRLN